MKNKLWLFILLLFLVAAPLVNFVVSTPSCMGFITIDRQETWINFYGALIGGALTLLGVNWTIKYTESTRIADWKKHEQELVEEFKRRDDETKYNLSVQFKPIINVIFDTDYFEDTKFGMSKYKNCFIQNNICLNVTTKFEQEIKRLVISLTVLNVGRGEANSLTISSVVLSSQGEQWETLAIEYKEICASNGINIMFSKAISEREWEKYNNRLLEQPVHMIIKIDYCDLVGYQHSLESNITIRRFISMKDEEGRIIPNVLVLNPYDSKIQNETRDENIKCLERLLL